MAAECSAQKALGASVGPFLRGNAAALTHVLLRSTNDQALFSAMLGAGELLPFVLERVEHARPKDALRLSMLNHLPIRREDQLCVAVSRAAKFFGSTEVVSWLMPVRDSFTALLEGLGSLNLRPTSQTIDEAVVEMVDAMERIIMVACDAVRENCSQELLCMCNAMGAATRPDSPEEPFKEMIFRQALPHFLLYGDCNLWYSETKGNVFAGGVEIRLSQILNRLVEGVTMTRDPVTQRIVDGLRAKALPMIDGLCAELAALSVPERLPDRQWERAVAAEERVAAILSTCQQGVLRAIAREDSGLDEKERALLTDCAIALFSSRDP